MNPLSSLFQIAIDSTSLATAKTVNEVKAASGLSDDELDKMISGMSVPPTMFPEPKPIAKTVIQQKKEKIDSLIAKISMSLESTQEYKDLEAINHMLKDCVDNGNRSFTKKEMEELNTIYKRYMSPSQQSPQDELREQISAAKSQLATDFDSLFLTKDNK